MPDRAIIGQYWPEDSLVHAMDPRVKFILSFVLMAAVFCAATPLSLAVAALFVVGFYAASRIPLLQAIRAIGPLLVLVVLTALLNVLFVQGGHVYFEFGIICISEKGIQSAIFIGCRLLLLLMGMSLLTLTTTTLDITAAFERLDGTAFAHRRSRPRAGRLILGIALRFLPQFMTAARHHLPRSEKPRRPLQRESLPRRHPVAHGSAHPAVHERLPPRRDPERRHGGPLLSRRRRHHAPRPVAPHLARRRRHPAPSSS